MHNWQVARRAAVDRRPDKLPIRYGTHKLEIFFPITSHVESVLDCILLQAGWTPLKCLAVVYRQCGSRVGSSEQVSSMQRHTSMVGSYVGSYASGETLCTSTLVVESSNFPCHEEKPNRP
jgi:hypothetical protein